MQHTIPGVPGQLQQTRGAHWKVVAQGGCQGLDDVVAWPMVVVEMMNDQTFTRRHWSFNRCHSVTQSSCICVLQILPFFF